MKRPVITLLSDFGIADHYVAAMKGVILGICPQAELVDISHEIPAFSIPEAAYTLAQAWQCFPKGTVHLAVVDPGVGSSRRAIVGEVDGHRFVAPDNGLLSMIPGFRSARIRQITASRYFRQPVSNTFHGRDIFAPVAAHIAKGLPLARTGNLIGDPVIADFAEPTRLGLARWLGTVLKVDRFGNVVTNFGWEEFRGIAASPFTLKIGRRTVSRFCSTYDGAPDGQLFAIAGSAGFVEISMNQQAAAKLIEIGAGSKVELLFRSVAK